MEAAMQACLARPVKKARASCTSLPVKPGQTPRRPQVREIMTKGGLERNRAMKSSERFRATSLFIK